MLQATTAVPILFLRDNVDLRGDVYPRALILEVTGAYPVAVLGYKRAFGARLGQIGVS